MGKEKQHRKLPLDFDSTPGVPWKFVCTLLGLLVLSHPALGQSDQTLWDQMRAQEWYLPTDDGHAELYVTEVGRGDTVVVLHGGWGAEHSYLVDAIRGLEDRFHFVFYDHRGSLRSSIPDHKADSLISARKHIQDLETLRKALETSRLTLMAHSMGTMLAMLYLHEYPEHVQGLVLLGAIPPPSTRPRPRQDSLLFERRSALADSFKNRSAIETEIREEGLHKQGLSPKEQSLRWKINYAGRNLYHVDRWRQKKGGRAFYNSASAEAVTGGSIPESTLFGLRDALARFEAPISVILGDHDYVDMGGRIWQAIGTRIPNIRLHVIERAGHSAWIDQPQTFQRLLQQSLQTAVETQQ